MNEQPFRVLIFSGDIANDSLARADLDATAAHVRARDADGRPAKDPHRFARIFEPARQAKSDPGLGATISGRRAPEFESCAAVLGSRCAARPDMASLTLNSMSLPGAARINPSETVAGSGLPLQQVGIEYFLRLDPRRKRPDCDRALMSRVVEMAPVRLRPLPNCSETRHRLALHRIAA